MDILVVIALVMTFWAETSSINPYIHRCPDHYRLHANPWIVTHCLMHYPDMYSPECSCLPHPIPEFRSPPRRKTTTTTRSPPRPTTTTTRSPPRPTTTTTRSPPRPTTTTTRSPPRPTTTTTRSPPRPTTTTTRSPPRPTTTTTRSPPRPTTTTTRSPPRPTTTTTSRSHSRLMTSTTTLFPKRFTTQVGLDELPATAMKTGSFAPPLTTATTITTILSNTPIKTSFSIPQETTITARSPQPSETRALKAASTVPTSSSTAPGSLSVATERKITRPCPLQCRCSENQADCSNLNLNEIPENLNMAEIVDLHGNNIKILNPATLSSLVDVVTLDLSDNSISNISEPVFSNMSQLKHLMVSHNPLNILSPAVFKDLPQLLSLEVDFTRFKPVPGLFNGLTKLRRLNLRGNELKTVDEILGQDGHASLPLLHHLDLSYNLLESLPQDIFQLHPELKSVRLVHNSWRCDQNLLFLRQAMRKSPHMFSLGHKVLCSTPENLKGKKVAQFNEDLLVTPTAMLPAVSKMSSSEPGKQGTATSPSPTTEEGDLPKHPTSVSGRTGVNFTTIIIVSVTGVLILVICLLVLIIVIRNLRKWKRVYKVHKNQKINAIIDYNRMDSSSDCDSLAHITILNSCHTEEGEGGVQIVSNATDKSLLIKTKTGHSTVKA